MSKLIKALQEGRVLIADGANGTMLQKLGLPPGVAPERWNLENPDGVRTLHKLYADAGSDMVLTNTFGGTAVRLKRENLQDQVVEINRAAATLAREAVGDNVIVLGDIGPTGELMAPLGTLEYEQAVQAFAQQAEALAQGGVDAFLIETMSDLEELRAAVEGVKRVSDLPVMASMSFDTKGRTMMGVKPDKAAKALAAMGVDIIGANCGRTLTETLEAVKKMREVLPNAQLLAKPNAGLPHTTAGELVYDVTPQVMAEYAQRFVDETGVTVIGGCCGSTPDHIRAIADSLK
jgi:5-methyltetrahydrofolate--homocysteine methyltransferase